jgi:putative DNA primase/helicase
MNSFPTVTDIARALGGKKHGAYWTACCPAHDDRHPSLSISEGADGVVLLKCHAGCSQGMVLDALRDRGLWPEAGRSCKADSAAAVRKFAAPSDDKPCAAERTALALRIWEEADDPLHSPVQTYLDGRGCGELLPEMAGRVIRYHPDCWFGEPERRRHPAMIALFHDVHTDAPRAIHRTALTQSGEAIVNGGKKVKLALGSVAGAAIKLSANEEVALGLGVAEGIETAISVMAIGWRPVWALGNAGSIEAFPVLSGIETLTIFADHDQTGLSAAFGCAHRWRGAGRDAVVRFPSRRGSDYADR